jgi:hypothetical protein
MAAPSGLKYNHDEIMDDVEEEEEPSLVGATSFCTSSEENGNDDDTATGTTGKVDEKDRFRYHEGVDKAVYPARIKPKKPNTSKSAKKKDQVNPYDVYMGRGGLMNRFRNGSLYRTLIVDHFEGYQRAFFKRDFAIDHIIKPIQKMGGRFFVPTKDLKGWTQGDIFEVIAPKVMQALRDCKKEDGNKAGHIYNTPIRNCLTPLNRDKTPVPTVKGGKTTSFRKKKTSKSPSSSSTPPKKVTEVTASSFNHPSNIMRKRLYLSTPTGSPSPKIPKLHNEFGGVPVSVAATSLAPDAPASSPFGTVGLFRHNLLLGSSPKATSSAPSQMQSNLLTLSKKENTPPKKVIMINESGHVMNTVHRTTGVCGFYHFLLSLHSPAFRRISEEDEGRFVWDNVVSPIQKQGGVLHLCCHSGKVQQEVNHKTIICISKVLRDTDYLDEECISPYGQSGATSTASSDEKNSTSAVEVVEGGRSNSLTGGDTEALTTIHSRVVTKEIERCIIETHRPALKQNDEDVNKRKYEMHEFNLARQEVMSIFQTDVKCRNFNPSDVKTSPVPLEKPAAGSYNALKAAAAAEQLDPFTLSSGEKSSRISLRDGEKAASPPSFQSQPSVEVHQNELAETKLERLTSSAKDTVRESGIDSDAAQKEKPVYTTCALVTQPKEKTTPVATRKSSRVAAAAVALEASPSHGACSATRVHTAKNASHATRSQRVVAVVTVTPEQTPSTKFLSSQGLKPDDVASDDTDCEKQQKVAWDLRYNELIEYAKKHGNCNVPQRCDDNPPLGRFVKINRQYWQRNRQGRKTPLTPDREARLGTRWEPIFYSIRRQLRLTCIFFLLRCNRLCLEYDSQEP